MARKPMITRTIVTTKVTLMCLNITSGEAFNDVVTLPRTFTDEKKLLKKVQEIYDNEEVKAVHIVDKEEIETLYGMDEQDFIKHAVMLDPETRKALESEANEQ